MIHFKSIMRNSKYIGFLSLILVALVFVQCKDDDDNDNAIYNHTCSDGIQNGKETGIDCGGPDCEPCTVNLSFEGIFRQEDQMGRPGVNLFFGVEGLRDSINLIAPHNMQARFEDVFKDKLMVLDSTFTTNVIGLNADDMARNFSKDVLWVAYTGPTSYYNGNEILTGRALGEDVMDNMLLWIFGGPDGTKNNNDPDTEPMLINDGVPANDAPFLSTFPYLAPPF